MRTRTGLVLTLGLTLVSGCSMYAALFAPRDTTDGSGADTQAAAELQRFSSEEEFKEYFAQQVVDNNSRLAAGPVVPEADSGAADDSAGGAGGDAPGALPVDAAPSPDGDAALTSDGSFSGTTIQEEGVDEADVVKTDGTYLYIINESTLKIVRAVPADQMQVMAEIPLEGYGRELYLRGDQIIALTETFGFYGFYAVDSLGGIAVRQVADDDSSGDDEAGADGGEGEIEGDEPSLIAPDIGIVPPYEYSRPTTIVTVIDAADRSRAVMRSRTTFDGTQSSSRMVNGVLHLVLANYPHYYYDVLPFLGRPELEVQTVEPETLLPHYTREDGDGVESSGMVLSWEDVYRPAVPDGFGTVAVVSMDIDNGAAFTAVGLVAEPGLIYSSTEALYVSNTNYDYTGVMRETTDLYKFAYTDSGPVLVGAGRVPGRILNQYSMGEYNGYLRVATTVDATFDENGVLTQAHNNVYVLGEADGALNVVGSVTDIAPRETIQSARFIGDRGYVVTFEQRDPLFTLDLSDPTSPRKVGELHVPGFSSFIVPMDADHLLTVGTYIPEEGCTWDTGVQLSIFDVSDFADPKLQHLEVIGEESGAWSEAQWNPKALTNFLEQGMVALPVSVDEYRACDYFEEFPPEVVDDGVSVGVSVDDADGGSSGGGSAGSDGSEGAADAGETDADAPEPDETEPADEPVPPFEPYIPPGYDVLAVYTASTAGGFAELGRLSTRFEDIGYYYASFTRGVFIQDPASSRYYVYAVTDNGVRAAPVDGLSAAPFELTLREPIDYGDGGGVVEPDGSVDDGVISSDSNDDESLVHEVE
ncbi:MAG: beta-propeller domain-containing protein [Planctomycetes bacterium]|nr:beta-propeller domain-containing protein [Planctomycetota bacterium]